MNALSSVRSMRIAREQPLPLRRALIVTGYVALFWGALPAALFALGHRFDRWLSLPAAGTGARVAGAILFGLAALQLARSMLGLIQHGRGLPISHLPPTRLVTRGLYARVRHPIYVAFSVAFGALALALGSYGAAIFASGLLTLGWIAYAKVLEEPQLHARFGAAYGAYAERTRLLGTRRGLPGLQSSALARRAWHALRPPLERLANCTTLYRGRRLSFVTYGAFVAAGAFAMALWSCAALRAAGAAPSAVHAFAPLVAGGMLAGGRGAGLAYRARLLRTAPREALRTVGFVSFGGYAGLLLAASAGAALLPLGGLPLPAVLDRLLLPGLLCSAIGRFGCLSYGCCGGRPWAEGLVWRSPHARIVRELGAHACVPRLPTQLLSSAHALGMLALLSWVGTHALPAGALSALGALLYGLGRLLTEHTRLEARFSHLQLTRGQFAALGLCAIGLLGLLASPVHGAVAPALQAIPLEAWLGALPIAAGCALLTAIVTGTHGPRVGHW